MRLDEPLTGSSLEAGAARGFRKQASHCICPTRNLKSFRIQENADGMWETPQSDMRELRDNL